MFYLLIAENSFWDNYGMFIVLFAFIASFVIALIAGRGSRKKMTNAFIVLGIFYNFYLIFPVVLGLIIMNKSKKGWNDSEKVKWGVVCLLFVNMIAGILILTSKKDDYVEIEDKTEEEKKDLIKKDGYVEIGDKTEEEKIDSIKENY